MKVAAAAGHDPLDGEDAVIRRDLDVEELFRAHARFVAAFLWKLGVDRADVDDQVQEVFVIAHRKGGYTAGPAAPSTWLAAIAVRVASHYRRGRGRRPEAADDRLDATVPSSGISPERALDVARGIERVRRALDDVDVAHRAVFVLFEIEHKSCEEIASALDIPIGTVHSRLHTARSKFRQAHARLRSDDDAPEETR